MIPAPNILDLHVKVQEAGRLKLSWSDPKKIQEEKYFHVDEETIFDAAKEVRQSLNRFVDASKEKKPRGPHLRDLAAKGHELWEAIFDADGTGAKHAIEVRDELLPNRQDCMILIHTHSRVYVPWGLVYDGDPDALPDDENEISLDHFRDFWCIKYLVSTLYEGVAAAALDKERKADKARVLSVVNEDCWTGAVRELPEQDKVLFKRVWEKEEPPITSSEEFYKTWRLEGNKVDILYFFCHASGSKLSLGKKGEPADLISMKRFKLKVRRTVDYPICLVFLNGCQTAIGAKKGGFMEATGRLGFCGFVGTEAKVPDLFALRFATDFFWHLLYEGKPVWEIFKELRQEHWPLSLLYSVSCHPLFQISSDKAPADKKPSRNLSEQKIIVKETL